MAEITGVLDGVQPPRCIDSLTMKPLGPLSGVRIMAIAAGILSYGMISVEIIAAGGVVCIAVHVRIFAPNRRGHGVGALNPSGLLMAEQADNLLAGVVLCGIWIIHLVVQPVGPQELGVVHLMGIMAGGTLDRVIHSQGFAVKPAHGPNSRRV
jgi:hypothetical protein